MSTIDQSTQVSNMTSLKLISPKEKSPTVDFLLTTHEEANNVQEEMEPSIQEANTLQREDQLTIKKFFFHSLHLFISFLVQSTFISSLLVGVPLVQAAKILWKKLHPTWHH